MKQLLIALTFLLLTGLFGQAPEEFEKDLAAIYAKANSSFYGNQDSLQFYSSLFESKLRASIQKNPSTLSYPFKLLTKNSSCKITTSEDGLFRVYSWDTWQGGTMHFFGNIYQFKSGNKIASKSFPLNGMDPDGFYSNIYILNANNTTYYLAIKNGIYSTKDMGQSIKIFAIANNDLTDARLIKTRNGSISHIDVEFDVFNIGEKPGDVAPAIGYDPAQKIIYIPIVLKDGKITDRFIFYQFTGQYFEYKKTGKKE